MLEIIMCVVIVCSTTFFANSFSQRLANRTKCLTEIVEAISRMKSLISFSGYDIKRVVCEGFVNTQFHNNFIKELSEKEEFLSGWKQAVGSINKTTGLNNEDKEILCDFSSGLGITDAQGQLTHLNLYIDIFSKRADFAKEQEKEKGRLYRILGFSLGCAVTLVIV